MPGADTTSFADAMKTLYLGPLNDQVYNAHVILNRLEKTSEFIEGNFAYVPLITGRNAGIGSRKDQTDGTGANIPTAGRRTYGKATFDMAYHYGRGQVSGNVIRRSKTDKGSFARVLQSEMEGLAESLPADLNRQLWASGNGRAFDIMANVSASDTQVEARSQSYFNVKEGDRVVFAVASSGSVFTNPAIVKTITRDKDKSDVASTTKHTLTFYKDDGTTDWTADAMTASADVCYFGEGTGKKLARAQQMHGIPDVINDGAMGAEKTPNGVAAEYINNSTAYGGITRSSNSFWKAQVVGTAFADADLTTQLLMQAWLTAKEVGGADPASLEIYTTPGLWATIGLLHVGDRRLSDSMEIISGFTAIKFNGSLIFTDRDCPRDVIWFIDMNSLMLLTQGGYELIDDDGAILRMDSGDIHAFSFTMVRDAQLGAKKCKTHVKLQGIKSLVTGIEANV